MRWCVKDTGLACACLYLCVFARSARAGLHSIHTFKADDCSLIVLTLYGLGLLLVVVVNFSLNMFIMGRLYDSLLSVFQISAFLQ